MATTGPSSAAPGRPCSRRSAIPDLARVSPCDRAPDDERVFVKLFGLERSGTNYLTWALERAFTDAHILVDETGWKHGRIMARPDWTGGDWADPSWPDDWRRRHVQARLRRLGPRLAQLQAAVEDASLRICVIVKDPYAWVSSYAAYRKVACSPVDVAMIARWNEINCHYHRHAVRNPRRSMLLRYEDLIADPRDAMDRLADRFGLTRSDCRRFALRFAMTATGRRSARLFDGSHYAETRFMAGFSSSDRQVFLDHLDRELMSALNYQLRDP